MSLEYFLRAEVFGESTSDELVEAYQPTIIHRKRRIGGNARGKPGARQVEAGTGDF